MSLKTVIYPPTDFFTLPRSGPQYMCRTEAPIMLNRIPQDIRHARYLPFKPGGRCDLAGCPDTSGKLQWTRCHSSDGMGMQLLQIPVHSTANGQQDNWNAFGCDVSEQLLLGTAQKIVDYGLRDLGYHYIILDDCWSAGRSANGTLLANTTKFPNGMAHVADQLHNIGLGFGMYSSAGLYTCAQYGRMEARTFMTYAELGYSCLPW